MVLEHDLSVDVIMKTPELVLNEWISKVGFHNQKAKFIKQTTQILVEKHESKVPD